MAAITVLEILGLFSVYLAVGVVRHVHWTANVMPFVVLISVGLAVANYYAFDHRDRWKWYAQKFKRYSRKRILIGRLAVAGVTLIILSSVVLGLRQDQQIREAQIPMSVH